jgi:heat shock protein HtpX
VTAVRNIYEQQAYNKRMTAVMVGGFVIALCLIGYAVDSMLFDLPNEETPVPIVSIATLIVGTGMAIWSLSSGWIAVLKSTGAVPARPSDPLQKQLLNVVEEMKIAAGLPMPRVYVIPDYDFNALSAGKDPQHCAIAVTDSLLKATTREELQGVIAHEMSHIRNYDVRLMTILASLVGAVILVGDFVTQAMKRAIESPNRRRARSWWTTTEDESDSTVANWIVLGPLYLLVWLFTTVLAPLPLKVMAMAVSRNREYLADAAAAELTRNPAGLAGALKKVGTDRIPTFSITRAAAHICIVDPTGNGFNDREGFLAELFGTHPPILKRIRKLEAMAYRIRPGAPRTLQEPH